MNEKKKKKNGVYRLNIDDRWSTQYIASFVKMLMYQGYS